MSPLKPASIPTVEAFQLAQDLLRKWREGDPLVRNAITTVKESTAIRMIDDYIRDEIHGSRIFKNEVYQVAVRDRGTMLHLSIKRIDRKPIHDWRDLQEIKNQIAGRENEAVELYPAESRKVDTANQYHLWVVKDDTYRFPFGFEGRFVTDAKLGKSVNRPF